MARVQSIRIVGRVAAMVLLLVTIAGPWAMDSHPATEETCAAPLIWLGEGHCACLVTPLSLIVPLLTWGPAGLAGIVVIFFLPLLPFITTLALVLVGERRRLRALNLAAWTLVAAVSALLFVRTLPVAGSVNLKLWGVWLCAALAVAVLIGETLAARANQGN